MSCGRQYRSAEKVSGAVCCPRIACIVTASVLDVNERRLCKISEEVEKSCAAMPFVGRHRGGRPKTLPAPIKTPNGRLGFFFDGDFDERGDVAEYLDGDVFFADGFNRFG